MSNQSNQAKRQNIITLNNILFLIKKQKQQQQQQQLTNHPAGY
jgi:hypothetical protein